MAADERLRMEADILVDMLKDGNAGAPISPHSAFRVNHSGFLNMAAVISTYVIVLVQFKVAEVQGGGGGGEDALK